MADYTNREGPRDQRSSETAGWRADFLTYLANFAVPGPLSNPTTTLTRTDTGASVPGSLQGPPSIVGTAVLQVVTGLSPGVSYTLTFTATVNGNILSIEMTLNCKS
jgi:hypothetical protein